MVQSYQLNTIIYGTGCTSYLATRTWHQLGKDESADLPQVAQALVEGTYVDNFITSADTIVSALDLRAQLTKLLSRVNLVLKNRQDYLVSIPEADREPTLLNFLPSKEVSVKILGLT